ncbi:unnamed protein product [Adineta ricciae]|uniref:Uncharacterized protein n=1 Tax=Adineta ricciae TaxID=249248 RepID=A0A813RCE7_ADIRI|nr:unnamed protein product [Adineta ricciae]
MERALDIAHTFSKTRHEDAENLTLIWLDVRTNKNNDTSKRSIITEQFHHIFNNVYTFDDIDAFIDHTTEVRHEFIFLIITDASISLANIGQILDRAGQIYSLYILQNEDAMIQHELELKRFRGRFSTATEMCVQLRKDATKCEHDLIGFHAVGNKNRTNDEQEANFMYAQLSKEYLLDIANSETNDITEMIEYCRHKYVGNQHELNRINELEKNYSNHSPVWWYTCDGFLYKMLNKALRLQDIETLYAMRVFTKELHEQLVNLHHSQRNEFMNSDKTILYRGQHMSLNEFLPLKNNQGGLVSMNSFLSTSKNINVAKVFAGDNSYILDDTIVAVLLKIHVTINDAEDIPPFACIDGVSFFASVENEVLFSMGTVFRIESITEQTSDGNFWLIELNLTNFNDPQLTELTQYMREQVQHAFPRDRLYNLLVHIGRHTQAMRFLQLALQEVKNSDQPSQAALRHQLAFIFHEMGDLQEAIAEYERSLTIFLSFLANDDPKLAVTYANMSSVYRDLGELDHALAYIQRALNIDEQHKSHETILAARFHCMGMIFYDQKKVDQAIEQFEKALSIWTKHLPPTHPNIAELLNNLATIYYQQKRYDEALRMYEKCLDIETKSLPPDHPSLAITYNNIALTYCHKDQYSDALDFSRKAIELSSRSLGEQHSNTQIFQNTLEIIRQKLFGPLEGEDIVE